MCARAVMAPRSEGRMLTPSRSPTLAQGPAHHTASASEHKMAACIKRCATDMCCPIQNHRTRRHPEEEKKGLPLTLDTASEAVTKDRLLSAVVTHQDTRGSILHSYGLRSGHSCMRASRTLRARYASDMATCTAARDLALQQQADAIRTSTFHRSHSAWSATSRWL